MNDQISMFDLMYQTYKIKKPVRLVELFSGYGSQAMAIKRLGVPFEHHRVVEFDKYAIASYNAVHGTNYPTMDVCDITGKDLGITDKDKYDYILTYSFPCTAISNAGERKGMAEGSGTSSSLLWEVRRILEELKPDDALPQVLLMENVPAIHSKENMPHFSIWLEFLKSLGYSTYVEDLNACDFGVAQNRARTFALSILGEYNYRFPNTISLEKCLEDYFEDLTEEQALHYIVKSEKARNLLIELDEDNKLS